MPELPEVETVVRYLRPLLIEKKLHSVTVPTHYQNALHGISAEHLSRAITNQRIADVKRRGKFIVLELDTAFLCIHLRMTGRLLLGTLGAEQAKHVTATFNFCDGTSMHFKDVRKFGRIYHYTDLKPLDRKLGVEPLSSSFTAAQCAAFFGNRSRMIKPLLLDQAFVVGIGNIYADEILWASQIHPARKASTLMEQDFKNITKHTKKILRASIQKNGTTFQSFYYGEEASGAFVDFLQVFGKTNSPCLRCGTIIEKIKLAQRGTHICRQCQPPPDSYC